MCENTVQQLPEKTITLITSTQIVTSVGTTVKELIENSIDAGAKVIQVRLENYGLDVIEVKDDGSGVSYDNVQKMFLPGYTSKIKQFEDLDNLHSYGFRGEALAAICKIANVSITTKTSLDTLAMTYEIDSNGLPTSSKPSHLSKGTIITVSNLFSNLPVRRLFLSSKRKLSEELKKTEHIIQSLSLIHPELGVSLIHNKCPIWRKNSVKGIKQSFMQVAGLRTVSKMEYLNENNNQINIDLIVPKKKLENIESIFSNSPNNVYTYVNKRPVNCKVLSQTVQEHIFHHYESLNISFKFSVCLVSVVLPPNQTDINLEPNKNKILLKNQREVIKLIDEMLKNYYNHDFTCKILKELESSVEMETDQEAKRQKLESPQKSCDSQKIDKNKNWEVEIINDDPLIDINFSSVDLFENEKSDKESSKEPSLAQNLCSQINSNNCCLSQEEVTQLNSILSETNHKLLVSKNTSNCETRLIDRNDIQSRSAEKPVLKEWPCRPRIVDIEKHPTVSESSAEVKAVEKMSEEVKESGEEINCDAPKDNNEKCKENENVFKENLERFDVSVQSISSQMGKKEMKAFTKFARIMRPKITEEFPNIMFTEIAGILADRWKALTTDEVKYYEKMAEVVDINRKLHEEIKTEEKPKTNKRIAPNKNNIKSMFENLNKKIKFSRPSRKEISLSASTSTVKKIRMKDVAEEKDKTLGEDFELIGRLLPSGNWLYKKGRNVGHVRHKGLRELILSQRMLSSFCVPRKPLEKAIPVGEEEMGSVLWNVLISLESEFASGKYVITSDVIVKNGFLVEITKKGEVITSAKITEVAESIPQFGISDLKDSIALYQKNGEFGGLASWRPISVVNFITNEAVRICSESIEPPKEEEIEEMINTFNLCFRHLPSVCPHSKEIFPTIYNLQNEISQI